jgi:hypothetical protein
MRRPCLGLDGVNDTQQTNAGLIDLPNPSQSKAFAESLHDHDVVEFRYQRESARSRWRKINVCLVDYEDASEGRVY